MPIADAEMRPIGAGEHLSQGIDATYRLSVIIETRFLRQVVDSQIYFRAHILDCGSRKDLTNSELFLKNVRVEDFEAIRNELLRSNSERVTLVGDVPNVPYGTLDNACVTLSGGSYLLRRLHSSMVRIRHVQVMTAHG